MDLALTYVECAEHIAKHLKLHKISVQAVFEAQHYRMLSVFHIAMHEFNDDLRAVVTAVSALRAMEGW